MCQATRDWPAVAKTLVLCALLIVTSALPAAEPMPEAQAAYRERVQVIMRDAKLSHALKRSGEGLVAEQHADGTVMVDLQGRFQHAMLARVNADGTVEMQCHDQLRPAAEFLAGGRDAALTGHEGHEHE
mgnify:CR=1 FL=1